MENGASSYRRFRDEGDERGLEEIIRNYRDGLILYLNSFVGDIQTAEELAEDTFVLLGTKKPRDKGTGSFKTWLYTIGRNIALNHLRKNRRRRAREEQTLLQDEADLETAYLREEEKITVHRAMRKLAPAYRQILWLVYFEGFSHKEAAAVMKRSVHSVETLVYRARKALKAQLETEEQLYEKL